MKSMQLTYEECPKTRAEFVTKFRTDGSFRERAKLKGFNVIGDSVLLPTGKVANPPMP